MPREARKRISRETLDVYAPLASRMGIYWLESELQDLSFGYLDLETYGWIRALREETLSRSQDLVEDTIAKINKRLQEINIEATVFGRIKGIYSIYQKMQREQLDFDQVDDVIAYRIVLGSEADCYTVADAIHSIWSPVTGGFRDYISIPKANGYRAINTTVVGGEGVRMEFQILTKEMDLAAEDGTPAAWRGQGGRTIESSEAKTDRWLKELIEVWQQELDDPREFFENIGVDLSPDEIYVVTPSGEVRELPIGSTPLDFAYSIHTDLGNTCTGARVNGHIVPLRWELHNGDTVEIVTSERQHPSRDWLRMVRTVKAKTSIRRYLEPAEHVQAIRMGREAINRELHNRGFVLWQAQQTGEILALAKEYNLDDDASFFAAVGYGHIPPDVVETHFTAGDDWEEPGSLLLEKQLMLARGSASSSRVKVDGAPNIETRFGKCCNPLPGDLLLGFVTIGRGVTVHKADCPHMERADSKRLVDVIWVDSQENSRVKSYVVRLRIFCENRRGMLEAISGVFAANDCDIVQAIVDVLPNDLARATFGVNVRNLDQLNRVISALESLRGVEKVERLGM